MSKKVAYYGIFASLAILMGYVEMLIPLPVPIPGIKLGLANVIVLLALAVMDAKSAFFISIIRILISGILFRGMIGIWYSMAGALLSFLAMYAAYRWDQFSLIGVSILGGIFHNVGQLLVACIILGRTVVLIWTPVLILSGVATGAMTGIVAKYCVAYTQKRRF